MIGQSAGKPEGALRDYHPDYESRMYSPDRNSNGYGNIVRQVAQFTEPAILISQFRPHI